MMSFHRAFHPARVSGLVGVLHVPFLPRLSQSRVELGVYKLDDTFEPSSAASMKTLDGALETRRAGRSIDVAGGRVRSAGGKRGAWFVVIALAACCSGRGGTSSSTGSQHARFGALRRLWLWRRCC
jgi:hypothetical protein